MAASPQHRATPSVGIIGAGLAGLAAARALLAVGVLADVFDKGRGAGGRASTRRVDRDAGKITFDHGAQYFTARDERFVRVVDEWQRSDACAPWSGVVATVDEPVRITLKPDGPTRFVGTPGMNAIVAAMARDVPVRFSSTVERVRRSGDGWTIEGSAGELGTYDGLVVATPAPQAATLLADVPSLATRARSGDMRPCWAVMAAFEDRLPIHADGLFVNVSKNPLSWSARDSSKPGRPEGERWVLHAGPAWSEASIEYEREDVVAALLQAFGDALRVDVPPPTYAAAHRWRYALTQSEIDGGCMLDAEARIAVAGDWCHGGRVEGAYLSGLAAGERLAGLLDSPNVC
ncbi:MAG: FAD-dependent oxidoreductase [Phycisphaerales bacterium]|jgi:renalase